MSPVSLCVMLSTTTFLLVVPIPRINYPSAQETRSHLNSPHTILYRSALEGTC
uniref:Uncharacterized protein n=1 Tax=Parascaris equorum TaxID=6256 RepID=A0A914RAY9_PAREQ